jgi:hypothetical protein
MIVIHVKNYIALLTHGLGSVEQSAGLMGGLWNDNNIYILTLGSVEQLVSTMGWTLKQ